MQKVKELKVNTSSLLDFSNPSSISISSEDNDMFCLMKNG